MYIFLCVLNIKIGAGWATMDVFLFFFFFSLGSDLGCLRATSQKPVRCFMVYTNALPEFGSLLFS